MSFPIVKRAFTVPEFVGYLKSLDLSTWTPSMVVLHNTGSPTLADRPHGFSPQNMDDLEAYYANTEGWSGGPHLFIDQNAIWAFNPLTKPGVNTPSWNKVSWGVEMLGDYTPEAFDSGPGLQVQQNAVGALAAMFNRLGLQPDDDHFKLHHEDVATTHRDCPGANVHKDVVRAEILKAMLAQSGTPGTPAKVVVYRKGQGANPTAILDATIVNGRTYCDSVQLAQATGLMITAKGQAPVVASVGSAYTVKYVAETSRIYLFEN